jgi:hypothetical protein
VLKGSCACGRIHYEIDGELIGPVTYCHCWRCRKQSGSSFGTTAGISARALRFLDGEKLLKSWESSSGVRRYFAGCCGSAIYKRTDATPHVLGFRLGTLDTDPAVTAQLHYMVVSRAPWVQIEDSLEQERGDGPEFGQGCSLE